MAELASGVGRLVSALAAALRGEDPWRTDRRQLDRYARARDALERSSSACRPPATS